MLRGRSTIVCRLPEHLPGECFISVITEFELFQGAARAPAERRASEHAKVEDFIQHVRILPFDSECAGIAARIRADLLNAGTPVGTSDVFIAATGIRHGWTIVTHNTRDFKRIVGLEFEDWH